ncbi:MAG: Hsp70 family protein [Candidatus Lernaella stagnicola]|nr:Hsp70 family protein [Candidatus Lernaella stagnicola]
MDIGIDLGTTFSVIAVDGKAVCVKDYPEGYLLEECGVTIIQTPEYEKTFPSVVSFDPDDGSKFIIGAIAKQDAEKGIAPVQWSKRAIGSDQQLPLGDTTLTAKDAARKILEYLKQCAESALGQPVKRAVITHPARFDPNQVQETKQAAHDAGFDMSDSRCMLMEPIAAALSYTRFEERDPLRIMVYDLGGGTFDVTILERKGGVITSKAFDGDRLLGGYTFDRALVEWIIGKIEATGRKVRHDKNNPEDRGRRARLLQYAEDLKIRLSEQGKKKRVPVEVRLDFLIDTEGRKIQVRERITLEEFCQLIALDLAKTGDCLEACLSKAEMSFADLDLLLLVGGSTHCPCVVDYLANEVVPEDAGVEIRKWNPDLSVAAGAAIMTEYLGVIAEGGDVSLHVQTPKTWTLPLVDIRGRVEAKDGRDLTTCNVVLRDDGGATVAEGHAGIDGGFSFEDVSLDELAPNQFTLHVLDAGGAELVRHAFTIEYDEFGSVTEEPTRMLAKAISVETASGPVLLVDEAEHLPTQTITTELVKLHDDPSVTINLLRDNEVIGVIHVEHLPSEATAGSVIKLEVCVTEKSTIEGTAKVFSPSAKDTVLCEQPVRVAFPPAPTPDLGDLEARFRELEDKLIQDLALTRDDNHRMRLAGLGKTIVREMKGKFAEMEPDVLEIIRLIKQLKAVVDPPKIELRPSRADFDDACASCRRLIEENDDKSEIGTYRSALESFVRQGDKAYYGGKQKLWSAAYDGVVGLIRKLMPQVASPGWSHVADPVLTQRMRAHQKVDRVRTKLQDKCEAVAAEMPLQKGKIEARAEPIDLLLRNIDAAIDKISDEIDPDNAESIIVRVLMPLKPIEEKIAILHIDTVPKKK